MNALTLLLLLGHPITVDTHNDCTQKITYDNRDIGKPQPDMHLDLDRVKKGGLDAQFFSIWVPPNQYKPEGWYAETLKQIEAIRKMAAEHPKQVALARTAADVRRNAAKGLLSALFGVEGGHSLGNGTEAEQLEHLRHLGELGVRYMTLTWTNTNPLGGSSGDAGDVLGLTDFGKRVIDEMNRQGIMIDISHVSDPMFWDVIRYVKKPVLASHSSSRQLANVARNMTDPMIKAVGKNGGAVCVNFYPRFLDADYNVRTKPLYDKVPESAPFLESEKIVKAAAAKANIPPVPLSKLIDHIDHIAKLVGTDHVCLGSDFDGIDLVPAGMEDVSKFQVIAAELKKRGYKQADIDKIMGGNVLRVMEANEPRATGWTH
jgi:membrane dipeptidase